MSVAGSSGARVGGPVAVVATLVACLALALPAAADAAIDKQLVVSDAFSDPVHIAQPPGDSTGLFVVEQPGTIRLIRDGALLGTPFLDIDDVVLSGGERGLLSVAFPPNYGNGSGGTTRRFYVYFTNSQGDIRIKEYKRSQASPNLADPSYSRTVLGIAHPVNSNHNGGQLQFGPDGYLYAASGDGGGQGDMPNNAQNKNVLLGKMLRINPLPSGSKSHTNPPGNPYAGSTPGAGEIFARGLRNPWRFSFDGERLTIGDVGGAIEEEVDIIQRKNAKGANFGWSGYEGFSIQNPTRAATIANHTPPDFSYPHGLGGAAIIGGYVVRDAALTEIDSEYVYVDAYDGVLRSFELGDPDGTDAAVGETFSEPSSFGVDNADHVYVTDRGADRVYRLIHTP